MRKIVKSHRIQIDGSHIYFDEMEEIYSTIVNAIGEVKIEFDGFEFDDFNEFLDYISNHDYISEFTFSSKSLHPSFYLFFTKRSVVISTDRYDGFAHLRVEEVLRGNSSFLVDLMNFKFKSYALVFLICAILFGEMLLKIFGVSDELYLKRVPVVSFFAGMLFMGAMAVLESRYAKVKLFCSRRVERSSFFKRNRDQLILQTMTGVVGAVLGSMATYFLS